MGVDYRKTSEPQSKIPIIPSVGEEVSNNKGNVFNILQGGLYSEGQVKDELWNIYREYHIPVSPIIHEYFENPILYNALRGAFGGDRSKIAEIIKNTFLFFEMISSPGLYGNSVTIGTSTHEDGRERKSESGQRINIDFLKENGVDISKVLFFRITQLGKSKPEYYWTSDLYEAINGLRKEISEEKRGEAVILVATLEQINKNGGLIRDINDDNGLAVRQIGLGEFSQDNVISIIKYTAFK